MSSLRRIENPPSPLELYEEFASEGISLAWMFDPSFSKLQDNYWHWDELRRKQPSPSGLNHRKWWFILKTRRRSGFRHLPLLDLKGANFVYSLTDVIQEAVHKVDLGAGGQIQAPSTIGITPETKDRYYISSLIQEAITSSQLEGAVTTRQVAKELLRTKRAPRDRSERMILNNYLAMERIGQLQDKDLEPADVIDLHQIVTQGALDHDSGAGRLRTDEDKVRVEDDEGNVYHYPPPAAELPQRLSAMCDFANGKGKFIHPVIKAVVLHFWLAYDHPFVDGNGRTARALFYWAMRRSGYWLCEFISISQVILRSPKQYYKAFLLTESDENDLTYFIHYHLQILGKAVEELHQYIARKQTEIQRLSTSLKLERMWNPRQIALLNHALRHPGCLYTIQGHRESHGIVYQTARTDLLELAEAGLLIPRGKQGKTILFEPPNDLSERLEVSQVSTKN